jgi:hypothetical protein
MESLIIVFVLILFLDFLGLIVLVQSSHVVEGVAVFQIVVIILNWVGSTMSGWRSRCLNFPM